MGEFFDLDKLENKFGGNRPNDMVWQFPPNTYTMISGYSSVSDENKEDS